MNRWERWGQLFLLVAIVALTIFSITRQEVGMSGMSTERRREQPELVFDFTKSDGSSGHYNGFREIDPRTGAAETDEVFFRRCARAACEARDAANREIAERGK